MPLITGNKTKTGTVRVWRPNGMRYAEGEWDSELSEPKYFHIVGPVAAKQAIRIALIAFKKEFGYVPEPYIVEITVQHGIARATVYDINKTEGDDA